MLFGVDTLICMGFLLREGIVGDLSGYQRDVELPSVASSTKPRHTPVIDSHTHPRRQAHWGRRETFLSYILCLSFPYFMNF